MNGSFGFKLSENFNMALLSMLKQPIFCPEVLTFKMVIKVLAWKPEVNENATLPTIDIAINDIHRLWPYNLRMPIFKWISLIEALVIFQILGKFHEQWNLKHKFKSVQQSEFCVVTRFLVCLSETQYLHAEIE